MNHLLAILLLVCGADVCASELLLVAECQRPSPGTVSGSCSVRQSPELTDQSPFPLLRWAACVQTALHLPSGGSADAIFFSGLAEEFETEIAANLKTLDQTLSKRDRKSLKHEQHQWEMARQRAASKRARNPLPDGTMYMMFGASTALSFPEDRAIELACRIEKLGER